MGGNVSKKVSEQVESAIGKFSDEELSVLKQTFDDLASRNLSNEKAIDKRTFLRIFNLPGMLGERLFAVFDRKKRENLDFDDFIVGLSLIVRGNLDEKIQFLFSMYDLNETGTIEKIELTTMLNSAVFAAYSIFEADELLLRGNNTTRISGIKNPGLVVDNVNSEEDNPSLRMDLKNRVDSMVKSAFDDLAQGREQLTLTEFKEWILQNPENLDVIEAVFRKNAVMMDEDNEDVEEEGDVKEEKIDVSQTTSANSGRGRSSMIGLHGSMGRKSKSTKPLRPDPKSDFSKERTSRALSLTRKLDYSKRSMSADTRKKFLDDVFSGSLNAIESPKIPPGFGSNPDLAKSFSTRRKLKPRIYIECKNCGIVLTIFFCYGCGKALEDDTGNCKTCGNIFINNKLRFCITCGFDLNMNDHPMEPPKLRGGSLVGRKSVFTALPRGTNALPLPLHLEQQHEGYLYRPGNLLAGPKKRWVVLRDNFLYVFKSAKERKPNGVIFLEGCFVESSEDEKYPKHPYAIEIVFNEEKNKSRMFWAETTKERDEWMGVLKMAAQIFDFNEYYEMGPELGTGKFSSVHECTHKASGKKYAVKVIDKQQLSDKDKESLRTEIAIMQLVNHPNVIHLKNVFEHRHHIYIVMSLVKGGDLFDRLTQRKRFDEFTARSVTEKLLKTVQYLHDYGIVHRDLKPENIMVVSPDQDDDIQIADFGLSKFAAPEEVMKLPCGTLAYVAPEVLQMQGYGKEVDLWSIGVILYVLLRGKLPFDGKKKSQIISKTISGVIPFEGDAVWEKVSPEAKDLISHLLQIDPAKRYTVSEALAHPWFSTAIPRGERRKSKAKPRRSLAAAPQIAGNFAENELKAFSDDNVEMNSQKQSGLSMSNDNAPSQEETRDRKRTVSGKRSSNPSDAAGVSTRAPPPKG